MVTCSTFAQDVECVLHFQNEFNIKLILLFFMFGYILFSLWYSSREISHRDDPFSLLKLFSFNIFPKILLVFFPFFLLTLKLDVDLELIISTLVMLYFLVLGLFIGLALYYGKEKIYEIIGDRRDFKSKFKYMKR